MPNAPPTHGQHERQRGHGGPGARPGATKQGYTYQWEKARKAFLDEHPLCVVCLAKGTTTGANVVDHIIPHRGNQQRFWDVENWQALCKPCHDRKTRRGE